MRLSVMTRQGAGHATADMEGYWFITGFGHDLASNSYYAFEGVLGSNALGDTSILVQSSDGTDLTVDPALAGSVSLAADGTLELNTGGPIFRGGVSADGRYAVMTGGAVGGDDPVILFLMR